jgi:hypothetical protein
MQVMEGGDMVRLRLSWDLVAVCGLICALLSSCDPDAGKELKTTQGMNLALSSRKLPDLPAGITDARCWAGGMFAKCMNVRFTASADQALDYLRRTGAACYLEFEIDGTQPRVLATHSLTDGFEDLSGPELKFLAEKIGIRSQPWFRSIYDIRHGWHYHNYRDEPARYAIYYDLDTHHLYIYWTYS